MNNKPRFIFILTTGHSGGTLLNLLLGTNPKVFAAGESLKISNLVKIGSQSAENQGFWKGALEELSKEGLTPSMLTEKFSKTAPISFWQKWIGILDNISDRPITADKSLSLETIQKICAAGLVDPFFVHLARDPRAMCYSYYRKYRSVWKPSAKYRDKHAGIESYLDDKRGSVFVQYEDLVSDPSSEVHRIFAKAGSHFGIDLITDIPEGLGERSLDDPVFDNRMFSGNRLRKSDYRDEMTIRQDVDYLYRLPKLPWFIVNRICRRSIEKFGYVKSRKAAIASLDVGGNESGVAVPG